MAEMQTGSNSAMLPLIVLVVAVRQLIDDLPVIARVWHLIRGVKQHLLGSYRNCLVNTLKVLASASVLATATLISCCNASAKCTACVT